MPAAYRLTDPTRGVVESRAIARGRARARFEDFVVRAQRRSRWARADAVRHGYESVGERRYDLRRQFAREQVRRHRESEERYRRRRMPLPPVTAEMARMERRAAIADHYDRYVGPNAEF